MLYSPPVYPSQLVAVPGTVWNKRADKPTMSSANILVIDPDIRAMRDCVQAFGERGWHVQVAENFVDALRLLEGPLYDLVLIEIALPDMLGTEAWTFIRKMNPAVSAIMTTSSKSLHRAINALGDGAFAYLLKPLDVQLLCNLIQQMLETRNAANELKRLRARVAGLYNLFSAITFTDTPSQIYDKALAHLRAVVHFDLALIYGSSPNSTRVVQIASNNISPLLPTLNASQAEFIESLAQDCAKTLQPIVLTQQYPEASGKAALPHDLDLNSCILVPLVGQRSVHGVLAILDSLFIMPSEEIIQIEMIAALAQGMALALDKAVLSEQLAALA